jgi:hypothetical protein
VSFYVIEGKIYKASTSKEAKELLKTTKKGKRLINRGKPIEMGKTYID